jgi:hypothetical protein
LKVETVVGWKDDKTEVRLAVMTAFVRVGKMIEIMTAQLADTKIALKVDLWVGPKVYLTDEMLDELQAVDLVGTKEDTSAAQMDDSLIDP